MPATGKQVLLLGPFCLTLCLFPSSSREHDIVRRLTDSNQCTFTEFAGTFDEWNDCTDGVEEALNQTMRFITLFSDTR